MGEKQLQIVVYKAIQADMRTIHAARGKRAHYVVKVGRHHFLACELANLSVVGKSANCPAKASALQDRPIYDANRINALQGQAFLDWIFNSMLARSLSVRNG